jgi:hypothetical protein
MIELPENFKAVIDALQLKMPMVPYESLIIDVNYALAEIATLYRLKVDGVLVNYYGMIFMPSGVGKDRPVDWLHEELLTPVKIEFDRLATKYRETWNEKMMQEAMNVYKTKPQQDGYFNMRQAKHLELRFKKATNEGFDDLRQEYMQAGFGGTNLVIREFADYLGANNIGDFLTAINEVYEQGDSEGKVTKGNKFMPTVKGVPSNALLHTSPSGIAESSDRNKLIQFFNRGAARRYFVCYPEVTLPDEYKKVTKDTIMKFLANSELADKQIGKMRGRVAEVMQSLAEDSHLKLTMDAKMRLAEYEIKNVQMRDFVGYDEISLGRASLARKALKLAGLIAMFEHAETQKVDLDDVEYAIAQCELFQTHYEKFYTSQEPDELKNLYNYIEKHPGVTRRQIRDTKILPMRSFYEKFDRIWPALKEMANDQNCMIVEDKIGKTVKMRIVDLNSQFDIKEGDDVG